MSININSANLSSLFSSLGKSSSVSSDFTGTMSGLAADMGTLKTNIPMIRTYYNDYLKNLNSSDTDETAKDKTNTSTAKNNESLQTKTDAVTKAASKLTATDSDLFTANEDGEYDREAIASAVTSFVDAYNDFQKATVNAGNTAIKTQVNLLNSTTKTYEGRLSEVGITLGEDGALSIDKEALNDASITKLKSLFNGSGSYASWVSGKASSINTLEQSADYSTTYSNNGNASTSSYLNSLFDSKA